jgi:hypothetical protein
LKYSVFETIVLVFGALAIVSSLFLGPATAPQTAEVVAQLMIIVVLAGALHFGRNGGFIAAVAATAVYVALRLPLLNAEGFAGDALTLIGIRVITYALVGVVGGEFAGRFKYILARLEHQTLSDRTTGAYSACYAGQSIDTGLAAWKRYETPYSLVAIKITPTLYEGLRAARYRTVMRQVAGALRNDIRMVDDLAFRPKGTFMALLPNTEAEGAAVVAARLTRVASDVLGANESAISAEVLSCSRDAERLAGLARELNPNPDADGCGPAPAVPRERRVEVDRRAQESAS